MPAPLTYTYCAQSDVEHLLSVVGVQLRLDDDGDGTVDTNEQLRMTDAINDATETINFYTYARYDPANLVNSNWIARRAASLAAYILCGARGNPVPDSLEERASKAEEELEKIHDSQYSLPGVPLRRTCAPVWDNVRVDLNYRWKCIRVERGTSSKQTTTQTQNQDWGESFNFEI